MDMPSIFPTYVARPEEELIRHEARLVREGQGQSRAVLLYGPGGVGKTSLVRGLAETSAADQKIAWLDPIDIDDPDYWLLSNLEQRVVQQLDPEHRYFAPYFAYLSRLPGYTRARLGQETVVSHLGRIKRVFADCYRDFAVKTGKTVVMVFDTVETIRGVYLVYTLTQWMKALPSTLFILSGRPLPGVAEETDPIRSELEDPHQNIPVTVMHLGEFEWDQAWSYLEASPIAAHLTQEEKEKLVLLTRGHPLWLAFALSYLDEKDIPEEAEVSLAVLERDFPYRGQTTRAGQTRHEAFKRRLVTPYREADFWHEAIKRLAVVRQTVSQPVWQRLMADRQLPADAASWDEAWVKLQDTPWIRGRANGRYVTLHDAVAEELALRIIPLHDQDQQWRRRLWQQATVIYRDLAAEPEAQLAVARAELDARLGSLDDRLQAEVDEDPAAEPEQPPADPQQQALIADVARFDVQKRELDQLKAASLHYQLLYDFEAGCRVFLELFEQARRQHDVLFSDRLALEIQRFLPGITHPYPLDDVIGGVIRDFRRWLAAEGTPYHLSIGLSVGDYLIDNERPQLAIEVLDRLPRAGATRDQLCQLNIQQGNAYMRIPGGMAASLPRFEDAVEIATAGQVGNWRKLAADAYNELGFFYRNDGLWHRADEMYQQARDVILAGLPAARLTEADRGDLASIQSNWAYLKGLGGHYREGLSLVESAISIRHDLKLTRQEGISWSVCGEVYRYERRFERAWDAFAAAEQIFQGQRDWSWQGVIYQQQAICLHQATGDRVNLVPGRDSAALSRRLIVLALDICRDQNLRAYPSALNRAGRIFSDVPGRPFREKNAELGLRYLEEGIEWARRISDGWFLFANLIEYAELSYRGWVETGRPGYRAQIDARAAGIEEVMRDYEFDDLKGRWSVLRGNLAVHEALSGDRQRRGARLDDALVLYQDGFRLIAKGYAGSSGASSIAGEFKKFKVLFSQLPPSAREQWLGELRRAWSAPDEDGSTAGSILLLARLEQLY